MVQDLLVLDNGDTIKMEILILILIFIGGWFLFKIFLPAIQMTREQSKDIGEASKYAKINDQIVLNAVDKTKLKYLIKKYKEKGYSQSEAEVMANDELYNQIDK